MNKKTLPSLLPLCLAVMVSRQALALGLGEAELDSYLGRPLVARIPILSAKGLDAEQMNVSLKPAWDEGSESALSNLEAAKISIVKEINPSGQGIIYLRSELPLSEPFLDFVLSIRWPSGSLQREYTLLLDLPPVLPASARSGQGSPSFSTAVATTATRSATPVARQAVAPPPAAKPNSAVKQDINPAAESYMTVRGDSLWSIASRLRAARGGDQQALMAQIYALNPQAFIRGNRNLLKESVRLDITPSRLSAQRTLPDASTTTSPTTASNAAQEPQTVADQDQAIFEVSVPNTQTAQAAPSQIGATAEAVVAEIDVDAPLEEKLIAVNGEIQAVSANIESMTARLEALQVRLEALQTQYAAMGNTGAAAPADASAPLADTAEAPTAEGESSSAEPGVIFIDDPALLVESTTPDVALDLPADNAVITSVQEDVLLEEASPEASQDIAAATGAEADSSSRVWLFGLGLALIAGLVLFGRRRKQAPVAYDAMPVADGKAVPPAASREDFEDVFDRLSPTRLNVVSSAGQAPQDEGDLSRQLRDMEQQVGSDDLVIDDIVIDDQFDIPADEELNLDDLLLDVESGEENKWSVQELRTQAAACVKLEDWEGAQRLFEQALALDEDDQDTRMELLDVYAHLVDVAAFESLALQAEFAGADQRVLKEIELMRTAMQERENRFGATGSAKGRFN